MSVGEALSSFRGHRVPGFRIIEHRKWWFALSGLFILLSLVGLLVRGLNFSISFKGGAQLQFSNRSHAPIAQYQGVLSRYLGSQDAQNSVVELLGGNQVSIQTISLTTLPNGQNVRVGLAKLAGISVNSINEQDVGPTWGSTISTKAIEGLVIFLVLVTLYISFRFEWKMSGSALAALVHDLIITAGIYALVGRQVTPESVIAILTILGYSLYDTVVIFDKIKENTDSAALVQRETYAGVVNMSLNQTLMRSVNTSLVVLLPIGSLLWFGGATLKDFAFALFVGVASGTYSSIFIASPALVLLKEREPRYQQIRSRAAVRAVRPVPRAEPTAGTAVEGDGSPEVVAALRPAGGTPPSASAGASAGARPRPAGASGGGGSAGGAKRKRPAQGKRKPRRR